MTDKTIFNTIKDSAPNLSEEDLDNWVVPSVMEFYDVKLDYLARHAYSIRSSDSGYHVAVRSFKEQAKTVIRSALDTYLFKKLHWQKKDSSLNSYLRTVMNRLSNKVYWDNSSTTRTRKYTCALCKSKHGAKEILVVESGMLRCNWCTKNASVLASDIKNGQGNDLLHKQHEYEARSKFALHSKKGYRCPECMRFMPDSVREDEFIVCPYDDCSDFGLVADLMAMSHPMNISVRNMTSINAELGTEDNSFSMETFLPSNTFDAELLLETKSDINHKLNLIYTVIENQIAAIKRNNGSSTMVQKLLMYKAYKQMTDEQPDDMVHYLCHRKHVPEPIQAQIFQKYVSLIENYLPFTMDKSGQPIEIISLTDPLLSLFTGVSIFDAQIKADLTIPNLTKEEYIGGRSYKNYGSCFIGRLIDVTDKGTNTSLLSEVKEYSFSKITMSKNVIEDTDVTVTHFRMPSHYEMNGLVFLQRIRRSLVDSIYFKLYNKKREITRGQVFRLTADIVTMETE